MLCLACSCTTPTEPAEKRYEFSQPQMGVPFRIVLYALDDAQAEAAAKAAFVRIMQLNDRLSDYDPDSELSRLSRTSGSGEWIRVSQDLWRVLERAQALARRTGGAFDVTVGPCVNLWRKARREKKLPDLRVLAEVRQAVGYTNLLLDAHTRRAKLLVPNMRLDLGAIAKGYAVDEALGVLSARGVRSALVSGGGDLAVSRAPPGRPSWRIELGTLEASNAPPPRFVLLRHAALATSGDAFQHLEIGGTRYSHILDPRTGLGLTDRSQVTVIAQDCMTADSLATAVSVLGPADGLKFAKGFPDAEVRILRQAQNQVELVESQGFRKFFAPP